MSENLPAIPEDNEPLIPRPELTDVIPTSDGQFLEINRDNAIIVEHDNGYEEFDHLFVVIIGDLGIRLFGIHASPYYEYLVERGYDRLTKQYPNDATVQTWLNMQSKQMERELEDDTGHELDDE